MHTTTEILSEKELEYKLNEFRHVLLDYDYSDVENVVFMNIDALNSYIQKYQDNPFERQYQDLEQIFNSIIPFIPSSIPDEAVEAITNILETKYEDRDVIKKNIQFNVKMDFIEMVKGLSSEREWKELLELCKDIRNAKEIMTTESVLH
ncbi:hypothetical protein EDC18_105128 [Natranaerovirga pectinivora]|uniref:Uncharacterized protein n=1 Tax=Natranaerovirga pectinivora TaxID=682400 RepID=A0A4R3MLS6_9FIRM|nr:hypothetical protein [Natranaerovirga pectinivora]TCT14647.1 hypothetical protein EDC18_105128 [Natranaerovirga pectinivora]